MYCEMLRYQYYYNLKEDLSNYKYSAKDTSPLSTYIMHPFWNILVKFVPTSIHPNWLTLVGWLCCLVGLILLLGFDFYGVNFRNQQMSGFLVFFIGFLVFLSHNLDGIDGKQARKLSLSSPMGEFMDHGLDSMAVFVLPCYLYSLFSIGYFLDTFHAFSACYFTILFSFYITHCEKYYTGILYLPWSYDLSMIATSLLFSSCIFVGVNFWSYQFYNNKIFFYLSVDSVIFTTYFFTFPLTIYNCHKVYKERLQQPSNTNPSENELMIKQRFVNYDMVAKVVKKLPLNLESQFFIIRFVLPLVPLTILFLLSFIHLHYAVLNLRIVFIWIGIVFSEITINLILSQMTNTPFNTIRHKNLLIFAIGTILSFALHDTEIFNYYIVLIAIIFLLMISVLSLAHYFINTMLDLSYQLNIPIFSIKSISSK